jgi:hypothetical protein
VRPAPAHVIATADREWISDAVLPTFSIDRSLSQWQTSLLPSTLVPTPTRGNRVVAAGRAAADPPGPVEKRRHVSAGDWRARRGARGGRDLFFFLPPEEGAKFNWGSPDSLDKRVWLYRRAWDGKLRIERRLPPDSYSRTRQRQRESDGGCGNRELLQPRQRLGPAALRVPGCVACLFRPAARCRSPFFYDCTSPTTTSCPPPSLLVNIC